MKVTVVNPQTKLLITETYFQKYKHTILTSLEAVIKTTFWRTHFEKKHFTFERKKFSWEYWYTLPFFSQTDYQDVGFSYRLKDTKRLIEKNIYSFCLRVPYRKTVNQTSLFLENFSEISGRKSGDMLYIQCFESYGLNLKNVLKTLISNGSSLVTIDVKNAKKQLFRLFLENEDSCLLTDPDYFLTLSRILKSKSTRKYIKEVILPRSFKERETLDNMKKEFPDTKFIIRHAFVDIPKAFLYCPEVKKNFGIRAVHPNPKMIFELINIQESGMGELVITSFSPKELGWIRYRTGLLGNPIFEKCICGSDQAIILKRVKRYTLSYTLT